VEATRLGHYLYPGSPIEALHYPVVSAERVGGDRAGNTVAGELGSGEYIGVAWVILVGNEA